eukprot:maker-scaffold_14-snap-gene-5.64-mRNA-1 protein AED:0.00 eAED:0.00 QI:115/1/1/1/1/1/2/79/130
MIRHFSKSSVQYQEMLKSRAQAAAGSKKSQGKQASSDKFFLGMIRGTAPEKPKLTPEQLKRNKEIVAKYQSFKFQELNKDREIVNKRRILHLSAIDFLPIEEMKTEALKPDYRSFPLHRTVPTWTPPKKT